MATGIVKQRGKSWYIVYPYTAEDGTYKRKWERAVVAGFPNTKRGAEQALRKRLSEIDAGQRPLSERLTVGDYIRTWHEGRKPRVSGNTYYNEGSRIENHIIPALGDIPLARLTRADVRAWVAGMSTFKPASIQAIYQALNSALRDAVEDGLVRVNVASGIKLPPIQRETVTVWDTAQITRFLIACNDAGTWGVMYRLILMTGLRRGEALALRWDDVDLPNARLVVNRTVSATPEGKSTIGSPKTRASHRAVNLPASLVTALQSERERQRFRKSAAGDQWQDIGLVLSNSTGQMLSEATARNELDRIISACENLPRLTTHQLRHTHATWLMANGVHPKIVSERLGHSRIGITMDLYSHVTETMQQDAADGLDNSLGNGNDSKDDSNEASDAQES